MLPTKEKYKVLIVGCGQLGSRHLQAVAQLPSVGEIEVFDPNPMALQLGKDRLQEISSLINSSITFRWFSKLEEASPDGDVCIVATQSKRRCEHVKQIVKVVGYPCFLLEKIVSQSIQEYEDLLRFSKDHKLSIWVNCKGRAYPVHQYVKKRLGSCGPILFHVIGGNHGLGNNGIHVADLFTFYDECSQLELIGASVDPILHPSKRGKDVFDLSGTLFARTTKGSHFILTYARDRQTSDYFSINAPHYRCIIDHFNHWVVESDAASGWQWKPVSFEWDLAVSVMSKTFVNDILTNGHCKLPTLEECFPAHKFILEMLQPHFTHLMNKKLDHCPIT